jgi:type IV pilus assembly protein PilO
MSKKMQQNLIVLAITFVALVFVYFSYLIAPLKQKYSQTTAQLTQTESKLSDMKQRALELPKLQADMALLEYEVEDLGKRLPKEKEIPALLKTMTKTAQKYHLKITNISPQPVAAQPNYNEVPFQITLSGSYHGFAHFLAELGQKSRILSEKNITFTSASSGSKDNSTTINANFILVAYTFKG